MEIDFRLTGLCKQLSNLYPHEFTFRGVRVMGMEPLLVGTKFKDPEEQNHIMANLHGFDAMKYGKREPWWDEQLLYWQGVAMERQSWEYTSFVCEAYHELFEQNDDARAALIATELQPLKHSIGSTDPTRTVLTRTEFCHILTNCRTYYQSQRFVEY